MSKFTDVKCPVCGEIGSNIAGVNMLFDDVQMVNLECEGCGTRWRAYYKIKDVIAEVITNGREVSNEILEEPNEQK